MSVPFVGRKVELRALADGVAERGRNPGRLGGTFIAVATVQTRSIIVGQPLGTNPSGHVWLGPLP